MRLLRIKAAILLMGCAFAGAIATPGSGLPGDGAAFAQGLGLDPAGGGSTSPEVSSPQMRELLPLIMQQLQNNPELMSQFGLGGLSGLNGLNGAAGGAGLPDGATGNIPGLNEAIAKALAQKNGGAGVVTQGIPEQVKLYREQYHPVDMDQDGRINADEAAAYASWMFRRRDITGDNVLVAREFAAVEQLPGTPEVNRQRLRTESRRLELLFPGVDANSDGMISKEEFLDHVRQNYDDARGGDDDIDAFSFQTVLPF
jgi:Ca2+-binding EF-hand superfamily protein